MIVETSAGQLFRVAEPADERLAHCWNGVEVKRNGEPKKNAKPVLVRKAGCVVVRTA